jgi:hypothetical protein
MEYDEIEYDEIGEFHLPDENNTNLTPEVIDTTDFDYDERIKREMLLNDDDDVPEKDKNVLGWNNDRIILYREPSGLNNLDIGRSHADVTRTAAFKQKDDENARAMNKNLITIRNYLIDLRLSDLVIARIMTKYEDKIKRLSSVTLEKVIAIPDIKGRSVSEIRYSRFLDMLKRESGI